ncbi:MAG: hypothetical protein A3B68_07355 [Candidatus Melainabacteria bacterium RIFCSPHIGHO2_02_FULL_34_12]|nr:MAG: hypothetical protein A3B68_07355 [Candidatus Melainabacteria bacterium RIFCSPHIGHO2_02_FULL_34_12]
MTIETKLVGYEPPNIVSKGLTGANRITRNAMIAFTSRRADFAYTILRRATIEFINNGDLASAAFCASSLYSILPTAEDRINAAKSIMNGVKIVQVCSDGARVSCGNDVLIGYANGNDGNAICAQQILSPIKERNDEIRPAPKANDKPFRLSHASRVRRGFCGNADEFV